jgi:hypothetical protein
MAVLARVVSFAFGVICLKLVAQWNHILGIPTIGLPAVEVDALGTSIHHEING